MTAQPPDLKKLREVAERATPIDTELFGDRYFSDDFSMATLTGSQDLFVRTFNPQTILALLDAYESSARDAERYRWLRQPNALRRAAHIAVLTHNGGFVACEEQADQAIDAARHATQGD